MKLFILISLALFGSGCTTVTTYDANGNMLGKCQVTGILRKGGQCIGYANNNRMVPHWEDK